jgi:hypothetical protein
VTYIPRQELTRTAFGEIQAEAKTPQVQIKFPYNLNPCIVQTLTNHTSSTVSVSSGTCSILCAATYPAFSQIRSLDALRYGPGQGAESLFTFCFTSGEALSSQVAGPGDDDEGFFFGYNGTAFGTLHRKHGELEIKSLEITAAAVGTGTITITIDGTAVPIEVTAGDSIAEVVTKIVAEGTTTTGFGNAGRGWEVHTDDNVNIEFISYVAETAGGTFSFTDTDTTSVTAGAFSTVVVGVEPTNTWTAQADWNVDTMDGTGPSGMTFDPVKLNVFKISFQYLGAGAIEYSIENAVTGAFQIVHRIQYAGTATAASLRNPTLHLTAILKTESGYSGGVLTGITASMAGFIQGVETKKGPRFSAHNTKSIGTTRTNILTVHNEIDWQSSKNKVSVYPDFMTISNEGAANKTFTFSIIEDPTEVAGTVAISNINSNCSVMGQDTAGTTITGGIELMTFVMAGDESKEIDLKSLEMQIRPGQRWVIAGLGTATANMTAGITWIERI